MCLDMQWRRWGKKPIHFVLLFVLFDYEMSRQLLTACLTCEQNLKLQHGLHLTHPVQKQMGKEDEEQPTSSPNTPSKAADHYKNHSEGHTLPDKPFLKDAFPPLDWVCDAGLHKSNEFGVSSKDFSALLKTSGFPPPSAEKAHRQQAPFPDQLRLWVWQRRWRECVSGTWSTLMGTEGTLSGEWVSPE